MVFIGARDTNTHYLSSGKSSASKPDSNYIILLSILAYWMFPHPQNLIAHILHVQDEFGFYRHGARGAQGSSLA